MMRLMFAIQTQQQEYDERNERRDARLTEETTTLIVCLDAFHDYIYHVSMTHPSGTRCRAG